MSFSLYEIIDYLCCKYQRINTGNIRTFSCIESFKSIICQTLKFQYGLVEIFDTGIIGMFYSDGPDDNNW